MGLDDGTIHVYDYENKKSKGEKGFKRQMAEGVSAKATEIDGPYGQFLDSTFEHSDSIISIETHPTNPC